MFYIFFALCLVNSALSACLPEWCCPYLETPKDFDTHRYIGRWYTQLAVRPNEEEKEKCYIMDYYFSDNSNISLVYSGITTHGKMDVGHGPSRVPNSDDPAKLKVTYTGLHETIYWILGTNYDNYTVTYGCRYGDGNCKKYLTILTRDLNPSESVINEALKVAEKNNFTASMFHNSEPILCKKLFVDLYPNECDKEGY